MFSLRILDFKFTNTNLNIIECKIKFIVFTYHLIPIETGGLVVTVY